MQPTSITLSLAQSHSLLTSQGTPPHLTIMLLTQATPHNDTSRSITQYIQEPAMHLIILTAIFLKSETPYPTKPVPQLQGFVNNNQKVTRVEGEERGCRRKWRKVIETNNLNRFSLHQTRVTSMKSWQDSPKTLSAPHLSCFPLQPPTTSPNTISKTLGKCLQE